MIEVLRSWYYRHFSDPQAVILAILLLVGFAIFFFLGEVLTPVIAAIVIAYVLEGLVKKLQALKVPHFVAVLSVVILFTFFLLLLFRPMFKIKKSSEQIVVKQ